jgi:hypothetical protein
MVDGESILSPPGEIQAMYQFTAYRNLPRQMEVLVVDSCVSCSTTLPPKIVGVLCASCVDILHREVGSMAKASGWASQVHTEHALLYAAAQYAGKPVSVATLASRSHGRMRTTRLSLERLSFEGYIHQDTDFKTGTPVYRFPTLAYPRELYEANATKLKAWEGAASAGLWMKNRRWLYALGLVVLLGGMTAWYLHSPAPPSRAIPLTAVLPESPRPAPQPASLPAQESTSPKYGKAYHDEAIKHATPIKVSIQQDGFTPVEMKVAASWNKSLQLSPTPPPRIVKEPVYQGSAQRYGMLKLGTHTNNYYDFVFDLVSGPNPVLYFDANQNGDLTDDGKPFTNQGSGIFATTITLPFRRLIKEVTYPGNYAIWFFTNDTLWKRYAVAHYSRTQLKGVVHIAGKTYAAYIADSRDNDANLTNDGLWVDLDGDGNFDRKQEYFPPDQVAHVHGKDYVFVITW